MDIPKHLKQFTVISEVSITLKSGADTFQGDLMVWHDKAGLTYCLSFDNKHIDISEEKSILDIDTDSNQDVYTVIGIAKVHGFTVNYAGQDI